MSIYGFLILNTEKKITHNMIKGVSRMLLGTIIYDHSMDGFIDIVKDIKNMLEIRNINIGIEEECNEQEHVIKMYSVSNNNKDNINIRNSMNLYLSMNVYNILSQSFADEQLKEYISEKYYFLNNKEINYLTFKIVEVLNCDKTFIEKKGISYINKKNDTITDILNCIGESSEFNLKGYITFRKELIYKRFIEICDSVIEDYIVDKEYKEFVKLLKYFVSTQQPTISEVNIIVKGNNKYDILNKKGEDITQKLIKKLAINEEDIYGKIDVCDILISGLITNVPKRIVIHRYNHNKDDELINTVRDIFMEKVAFCSGCEFCSIKNKNILRTIDRV